jgi:hypothetical protein
MTRPSRLIQWPSEHVEAVNLARMIALHERRYPALLCVTTVPHGGHRHPAVAGKLKAEGLRAGYPDYLCDVPRQGFNGLRIELKRQNAKPSDTDPAQVEWHDRLRANGYRVEVCKGWEAAWAVLCDYLGIEVRA